MFLLLSIAPCLSATAEQPLKFYVATNGNDAWSGRQPDAVEAGTDGPFATLEKARDAARAARKERDQAELGVAIYLRGGRYFRQTPFVLRAEDSGTAKQPVVYSTYKNEPVSIVGGKQLKEFVPVSDTAIRERLNPAVQDAVRQIDLTALGINDFGQMTNGGQGRPALPETPELFVGKRRMTLARWPNDGTWATVKKVPENSTGKFVYGGDRPALWLKAEDAWLYGYWKYDWADSYEKIATIDLAKSEIKTVQPYPVYGIEAGKRWCALNILEELDQPGEWYLERKTGILYFYPPGSTGPDEVKVLSMVKGGLITLEGASNVTICGLTLEDARENGVTIRGGTGNRVIGCTICNVGRYGVVVEGATDSGVTSCDIHDTGLGGVLLDGGDRKTLTPGKLYAENNDLHHLARLIRTYRPAISLKGVGARVASNYIHDLPHVAILCCGNDHVVEYNEITRVCQETGDAGAFYIGRDYTQRGNIVRHSYFHHLRAGGLAGQTGFTDVMAVYLDDCSSGCLVYGNFFLQAGRSLLLGGGRDNIIQNNIIQEGTPAIHVDAAIPHDGSETKR